MFFGEKITASHVALCDLMGRIICWKKQWLSINLHHPTGLWSFRGFVTEETRKRLGSPQNLKAKYEELGRMFLKLNRDPLHRHKFRTQ